MYETFCSKCYHPYKIYQRGDSCPNCAEAKADRRTFHITLVLVTVVAIAYVIALKVIS